MMIVEKNGRSVAAMSTGEPAVNGVIGIVQCNLAGCEAYLVMLEDDGDGGEQILKFLETHDCDVHRVKRTSGPFAGYKPGQRIVIRGAKSSWGRHTR